MSFMKTILGEELAADWMRFVESYAPNGTGGAVILLRQAALEFMLAMLQRNRKVSERYEKATAEAKAIAARRKTKKAHLTLIK